MKEFLFYIDFRGDPSRPFYTLLGGVRVTNFESTKALVETADYTKDFRMFIPGSGVQAVNIDLNGFLENYKEQFSQLFKAHNNSESLDVRLTSGEGGVTVSGQFIIESLTGSSEATMQNEYSLTLVNIGEVTIATNG